MAIPFTKDVLPLVLTGIDAGGTVLLITDDAGICGIDCGTLCEDTAELTELFGGSELFGAFAECSALDDMTEGSGALAE